MKRRLRQLAARVPVVWTDVKWLPPVKQMARRWVNLSLHRSRTAAARSFTIREIPLIRYAPARPNF